MPLELENVESLKIDITFPDEDKKEEKIFDQLLKINLEKLISIKSPLYSFIEKTKDFPTVYLRSPNQTYIFSKNKFSIEISGETLYPELFEEKEEIELTDDFLELVQNNYNFLAGLLIGNYNETIMNIEERLNLGYNFINNFNDLMDDRFLLKLNEIYEGIITIDGILFERYNKSSETKTSFRFWIDREDEELGIRYIRNYKTDISSMNIKNIIINILKDINIYLSSVGY